MFEIITKVIIIVVALLVLLGYIFNKIDQHKAEGGTTLSFVFYSLCAGLLWFMIISAVS